MLMHLIWTTPFLGNGATGAFHSNRKLTAPKRAVKKHVGTQDTSNPAQAEQRAKSLDLPSYNKSLPAGFPSDQQDKYPGTGSRYKIVEKMDNASIPLHVAVKEVDDAIVG